MKSNRNNVDIIFEEINNISVPQFDIRIDLENLKHGLRRILFWLSFGWLSKAIKKKQMFPRSCLYVIWGYPG